MADTATSLAPNADLNALVSQMPPADKKEVMPDFSKPMSDAEFRKTNYEASQKSKEATTKRDELIPSMKPPVLTEAPKEENYQTDPMKKFGSPAMLLATLGSLLTRKPLTSALNAGAEVNKAYAANDAAAFKAAMDKWKLDTDNSWKMADWEQSHLKFLADLYDKDANDAVAQAKLLAANTNMPSLENSAKMGELRHLADEHAKWLADAKEHSEDVTLRGDIYLANIEKKKDEIEKKTGSRPDKLSLEDNVAARETAMNEFKQAKEGKLGTGKSATLTPEQYETYKTDPAMQLALRAYMINGDPRKALGGGVFGGASLAPKVEALQQMAIEKDPNFNPAIAAFKYQGYSKELNTVELQNGKISLASNILDSSLPSLQAAAKKLDLSNVKGINNIYNAARSQLNDADFKNFSTQMRAVATDYGQFIGRTGGTVHSDEEAMRILNEGMSDTSLQGFADAVRAERDNVQAGIDTTLTGIENKLNGGALNPTGASKRYSPSDYKKAIADKTLKSGDTFLDKNGIEHTVD